MNIMLKNIKMEILLWIQGWTGQLNSWAWTKWDILHREDWSKGYKKWKSDKTESEKLQDELEPLPDMKLFNTKRENPFKEGTN